MTTFDTSAVILKAKMLVSQAKVRQGLRLLKQAYGAHPSDFQLKYAYAQLLGDCSFSKNGNKKMRARAVALLRQQTKGIRNRTPDERWKVLRHLYYFSGQHLKNYRLGKDEVLRGNKQGYLSQGIGAGCHAFDLLKRENKKHAEYWAKKAERAWLALFRIDSRQPNRLLHFARILSIQGRYLESSRLVTEAIKVSGESISSFRSVNAELAKIKRIRGKQIAVR